VRSDLERLEAVVGTASLAAVFLMAAAVAACLAGLALQRWGLLP
jgi:hypothetical protein